MDLSRESTVPIRHETQIQFFNNIGKETSYKPDFGRPNWE
jgi:hypothetical protein